jgi:hypothetical protein
MIAAGLVSLVIGLMVLALVRAESSYSSLAWAMVLVGSGRG